MEVFTLHTVLFFFMVQIYTLTDPRTNIVRYVGKTVKPLNLRLSEHFNDRDGNKKSQWIRGLKKNGLKPIVDILDIVNDEDWRSEEMFYISYFRFLGLPLLNMTDGGDGNNGGKRSEEFKKQLSKSILSNPKEIEARRIRRVESNKRFFTGRKLSQSHKDKVAQAGIGRKIHKTEESRRRLNNFLRADPERYKQIVAKRAASQRKAIAQYDKDMNEVARHLWSHDAAKAVNGNPDSLSCSVRKGTKYKGFYWKYIK